MTDGITRRGLLKVGGAALLTSSIGCQTTQSSPGAVNTQRRRSIRIAHMTDMHLEPELKAGEWGAACFRHVQNQQDPPDLILNGGDIVMDSLHAKKDRVGVEWGVVTSVLRKECSLPILHCIGNHDVWGWDGESSLSDPKDALYGKAWAQEALGLAKRYYSQDLGDWQLIVLDSTHVGEHRVYDGKLDEEQMSWLKSELAAIPLEKHVIVLSHIPILCAAAYFDGDNEKSGDWIVPGSWMHRDARELKDLFHQHRNVRLAISGHIHLLDRIDYNGVTYLCNGAVCGNWWKGDYQETPPGYAMLNLYTDGSFDHEYVTYGWKEA